MRKGRTFSINSYNLFLFFLYWDLVYVYSTFYWDLENDFSEVGCLSLKQPVYVHPANEVETENKTEMIYIALRLLHMYGAYPIGGS